MRKGEGVRWYAGDEGRRKGSCPAHARGRREGSQVVICLGTCGERSQVTMLGDLW